MVPVRLLKDLFSPPLKAGSRVRLTSYFASAYCELGLAEPLQDADPDLPALVLEDGQLRLPETLRDHSALIW